MWIVKVPNGNGRLDLSAPAAGDALRGHGVAA
jgi:predicted GNAT family acetyltransferase